MSTEPTRRRELRTLTKLLSRISFILFALILVIALATLIVAALQAVSSADASQSPSPGTTANAPASTAAPTPEPPDPAVVAEACGLAARQLARGNVEAAHDMLTAAGITAGNSDSALVSDEGCQTVWVLSSPEDETASPLENFGKAWDSFVKTTLTPISSSVTFILAAWLALFVIARLLVEHPLLRDRNSDPSARLEAGLIGWGLVAGVPVAAVLTGALAGGHPVTLVNWILLAFLAATGATALAAWLATLRVIRIDSKVEGVTDDGKFVSEHLVAARLRALAGKSKSIEIPSGPSVSTLAADLKDMSTTPWVAAVQRIVLFLIGVTPWVATVVVRSADSATITISRNRAFARATVLRAAGDGLEALAKPPAERATGADILSVLVAAELLICLSERYPGDFEKGLAGATDARSIALQYIAIEWYTDPANASQAASILASAVRADPSNLLARYSLDYVENRHQTDRTKLTLFGDRLDRRIAKRLSEKVGFEDELLRGMIVTRAAAARNLAALAMKDKLAGGLNNDHGDASIAAIDSARHHVNALLKAMRGDDQGTDRDIWIARLKFSRAALVRARTILLGPDKPPSVVDDIHSALKAALRGAEEAASQATANGESRQAKIEKRSAKAIRTVQVALRSDLFTSHAGLAYTLAAELVCWERQKLTPPSVVEQRLDVATRVRAYREFAADDPELATADDFALWQFLSADKERRANRRKTSSA